MIYRLLSSDSLTFRNIAKINGAIICLALILMFAWLPSSSQVVSAQHSAELVPYFGTGVAVLHRPSQSDFDFNAIITDDSQHVIGYSGENTELLFVWDISNLEDDIIIPEPELIDLNTFMPQDFLGTSNAIVKDDSTIIMQYADIVLEIDIFSQTVIHSASLADILPADPPLFRSISVQMDMIALFYDDLDMVVLWNTASNTLHANSFDEEVSSITAFRDGWQLSQNIHNAATHYFYCDLMLETCIRAAIFGNLVLDYEGVLIFGDNNPYSYGDSIAPTSYTFDMENGITETESPFPNLPDSAVPVSISPDGQYIRTLTRYDDHSSGGNIPLRGYDIWEIEGDAPLYSIGITYPPLWFGDHFIAQSPTAEIATLSSASTGTLLDSFSIYEMRGRQELPYDNLYDHLGSHPEINHLRQISDDGTRFLHVSGSSAIVLPIEYQAIDGLLTVQDNFFSVERGENQSFQSIYRLSVDGKSVVHFNPNLGELTVWNVDSGESNVLDIRPFLTENSVFDVAIRNSDLFLQIDNTLRRLTLPDLIVRDELVIDDRLTFSEAWAIVVQNTPSIQVNDNIVAALFDHTTAVWYEGAFSTVDIGGERLYPLATGWMIYDVDYSLDPDLHEITRCDFLLLNCTVDTFEGPLAAIIDDDYIVSGNSLLAFQDDFDAPTYWAMGETITQIDPIFDLPPTNQYMPASFHRDYAIIAAPSYDFDASRHYEIWSTQEAHRLSRIIFRGDWVWHDDYLIAANERQLTFFHLLDGRFTRWTATSTIRQLELSANGSRLMVVMDESVEVIRLIED